MKQPMPYRSFIRLCSVAAVLFIAGTLYTQIVFGTPDDQSKGWIWNAYRMAAPDTSFVFGLGWTSMSCLNDFDNDGLLEYQCDASSPYGLTVATGADATLNGVNDYVQGCAWSSEYGWVCFNGGAGVSYQCNSLTAPACADLSTNGVSVQAYTQSSRTWFYYLDSPTYNAGSWSQLTSNERAIILSLWKGTDSDEEQGYIGFPASFSTASTSNDGLLYGCVGCGKKCSNDKNTTCESDADCSGGGTCGNYCNACLNTSTEAEKPDGDPQANPNPNLLCWDCGNGANKQCTIGETTGTGSCVTNRDKNKCLYSSCTGGCTDYTGVIVNEVKPKQYELCGWGYHAYTAGAVTKGLGWVAFNSEQKLGDTTFIDVQEGSIFSGGNIYSPSGPPTGKYNAAYIIEASGDITNWFSKNAYLFPQRSTVPTFLKQQSSGVYSNVLGRLDYRGIVTNAASGVIENGTNKYGAPLFTFTSDPLPLTGDKLFNGATVVISGPVTAPGGRFLCGVDASSKGSGVIVVDGDLTIEGDYTYQSCPDADKLTQIPSIVWIVKGDIAIHSAVSDIAGTFIVLGNDGASTCPALSSKLALPAGCGRFSTGDSVNQLTINGSVLARQFNFQRSHSKEASALEPAEEFVSDGRLQANPPAGLADFTKSVPRFSSGF